MPNILEWIEEHGAAILGHAAKEHERSGHFLSSVASGTVKHAGRRFAENAGSRVRGDGENPHWLRAMLGAGVIGAVIALVDHWAENHLAPAVRRRFASQPPAAART